MISLIYRFTCPACKAPAEGVMVQTVRINKHSMRTTDAGLGFLPRNCRECDTPLGDRVEQVRVHDPDLVRINEHRARKGWPGLTSAQLTVRAKEGAGVSPDSGEQRASSAPHSRRRTIEGEEVTADG